MNTPTPAPTATSRRVAIARQQATHAKRSVATVRTTQYWVHDGQRMAGPFTSQKLRRLAAAGRLKPSDLVRNDLSGWVHATRVKGLEFSDLPPRTQTVVSRAAARPHERSSSPPHASNGHATGNAHVEFGGIEFANRVLCEARQ